MSVLSSKPALRWLVPSAAAVVILGGGAVAGTIVANAGSTLPPRSAAQLLADVQNAKVTGLSGTIVETADLGIPDISGLAGAAGASGSASSLTSLLAGSNTAKVWYGSDTQQRVAVMGTKGETDVIRNGADVWVWQSQGNKGTHATLPADAKDQAPHALATSGVPQTPQQAAAAALAAIDPTTTVTTTGAAKVAGRDAYELVLSPKDPSSQVGQVRLAIDAKQHIPLRVDVYAKNATSPAIRVAFQQISFAKPDAQEFQFKAPAGAKITNTTPQQLGDAQKQQAQAQQKQVARAGEPKTVGKSWTTVVVATMPKAKSGDTGAAQLQTMLQMLPAASGSWGKGHIFTGSLFSVLITDNGKIYAGLVTPEKLYQVAAADK